VSDLVTFPDATVHLVRKTREPVMAGGTQIIPTMTFTDCPRLDLICASGGAGMNAGGFNDARRSMLSVARRKARAM
jgi:hypothetical protein